MECVTWMERYLAAGITLVMLSGCQSMQPSLTPLPTLSPTTSAEVGFAPDAVEPLVPSPAPALHTSQWWEITVQQRDLDLVRDSGFRWVKQIFPWREIEVEDDVFDWTQADQFVENALDRKLFIVARLDREPAWALTSPANASVENTPPSDYAQFEAFCYEIAYRYRNKIRAYQVWNEPNLAREWGGQPPNPDDYVRLLAHCYNGIKRGDPAAIVISAGLAPTGTGLPEALPDEEFLRRMYAAGAARYFDMLGVNAPGYKAAPWLSPEEAAAAPDLGGQRWAAFRHVEDVRRIMVEAGDATKQIAILEMGWTLDPVHPEYAWFAVSEQQQAEYLSAAYHWAHDHWQPWIGIMTTIYIPDQHWTEDDEQYWWSVVVPGWPHTDYREAYWALVDLPDWDAGQYPAWDAYLDAWNSVYDLRRSGP